MRVTWPFLSGCIWQRRQYTDVYDEKSNDRGNMSRAGDVAREQTARCAGGRIAARVAETAIAAPEQT